MKDITKILFKEELGEKVTALLNLSFYPASRPRVATFYPNRLMEPNSNPGMRLFINMIKFLHYRSSIT